MSEQREDLSAYVALTARMDGLARELGLRVLEVKNGRQYLPASVEPDCKHPNGGVGVFRSSRGIEITLTSLRRGGHEELADDIAGVLNHLHGGGSKARNWPAAPSAAFLAEWDWLRREVLEPYYAARREIAGGE